MTAVQRSRTWALGHKEELSVKSLMEPLHGQALPGLRQILLLMVSAIISTLADFTAEIFVESYTN